LRAAPAVSLWQDFNMILRIFPNDAELEFMPRVIDPAYVKSVVESHLSALGLPSPASGLCWRCEEARYDHIKLLPGKRCVLRHRATLVGPDNEKRELRFFSKTYADHRTRPSFDLLRTAYDHLAAGDERINIPKPLFYLEECETYWQEEWPGQALSEVAADYDWGELFPRLAQMLGLVHRKSIAGLEAAPTIEEIFREVSRDAMKLVQAMPPAQGLMEVVLDKLQEHKDALAAQSLPAATLHGACRLEQFLIQGRELALIDFDALAQGDPLADVAEFIASLQYMELSRGFPRARINRGIALLGESYAAQTSWPYEAQRVAWYVLSFLITKMYSATKNLDTEALHGLKTVGQEICESWLARL
jgi:aminoglycoside phosphotransferase (APT) family kinase protein